MSVDYIPDESRGLGHCVENGGKYLGGRYSSINASRPFLFAASIPSFFIFIPKAVM